MEQVFFSSNSTPESACLDDKTIQLLINMDCQSLSPRRAQNIAKMCPPEPLTLPHPLSAPNPRIAHIIHASYTDLTQLHQVIDQSYSAAGSKENTPSPNSTDTVPLRNEATSPLDEEQEYVRMNQQLNRLMRDHDAHERTASIHTMQSHGLQIVSNNLQDIGTDSVSLFNFDEEGNEWDTPRIANEAKAMKQEMFNLAVSQSVSNVLQ
eukprot:355915_1